MTVKNIEPLTVRPNAFCLPPETACEILSVLNEINEDYKIEFNKNNCKAKDTLAGFAQAFTVMTSQAFWHLGKFFDFDKDGRINDRVINHPTKDPLPIKLKKLKIDPFVCEKIAYYQEKIAPIRNQVLFNGHGEGSDIWSSFSEENFIEIIKFKQFSNVFLEAAKEGDVQIIRIIIDSDRLKNFNPFGLEKSFEKALEKGHLEIVRLLINTDLFHDFNLTFWALEFALEKGYTDIPQMLIDSIDSRDFQYLSLPDLVHVLDYASERNYLPIIQAIKATDLFKQLLKDFPEKFNKF
jgi:hypothetical protein